MSDSLSGNTQKRILGLQKKSYQFYEKPSPKFSPKLLEHDERLERLQKCDERLLITRGELFVSGPRVLSLSAVPMNGLF